MDNTILSLFEKRLRDLPDSVCVLDETRKLTARELDRLSDTIAQMLPHGAKQFYRELGFSDLQGFMKV